MCSQKEILLGDCVQAKAQVDAANSARVAAEETAAGLKWQLQLQEAQLHLAQPSTAELQGG